MFNKKNLDELLGIGRVRAGVPSDQPAESVSTAETKEEVKAQAEVVEEMKAERSDETSVEISEESSEETVETASSDRTENPYEQKLIELLEKQVRQLERQLETKDQQLASKDEIIKNFQVLLKIEQENVLKLTGGQHQSYGNEEIGTPQKPQNKWFFWRKNEQDA